MEKSNTVVFLPRQEYGDDLANAIGNIYLNSDFAFYKHKRISEAREKGYKFGFVFRAPLFKNKPKANFDLSKLYLHTSTNRDYVVLYQTNPLFKSAFDSIERYGVDAILPVLSDLIKIIKDNKR